MTQPLSWPPVPQTNVAPRSADFRVDGSFATRARAIRRGRKLFAKTQRLLTKKQFAAAGEQVVATPVGLGDVEVRAERLGLQWCLALSDLPQRSMFAWGGFDDLLVAWVLKELRADDVVVDIGAHVGLLSVQFANRLRSLGGGAVYSFEPAPDSAARLRLHAELNDLQDVVTVVQAAVGEENGEVALRRVEPGRGDDPSLRSIYGTGDAVAESVQLLRFDDWWSSNGAPRLDFVKIDVEGAELGVVRGMRQTLERLQPRLLVVEIKEHLSAKAGVATSLVVDELAAAGYTNRGYFSQVVKRQPMPHLDENFIFTRTDT